mmetsp:Transcript_4200/g.10911  ORF Transcript_4200/g.10911 Transcript_4200/m.10911 type:complete len:150 (+) Transcript_4200:844-1293(+)
MAFMKGDWREKLLEALGWAEQVDTEDANLTMEEINRLINYKRRYALALLGPGIVLLLGVWLHYSLIREPQGDYLLIDWSGVVDSFYWAVGMSFFPGSPAKDRVCSHPTVCTPRADHHDDYDWIRRHCSDNSDCQIGLQRVPSPRCTCAG